MGSNERLYILKTVDGEEYGPVDQDCLVRWAENGRITAYCQIRSTLIARWEKACEIPFLRDILLKQVEEKHARQASILSRVKSRMTMRAAEVSHSGGLHDVRPEDFEAAPTAIRALAGLVDAFVLLLVASGTYLVFALLYAMKWLGANEAFYLGCAIFYLLLLLYFTYSMGCVGQTAGQKFWGIILIRRNGEAYYLGRAFVYTMFLLLFGLLTPLTMFVAPSNRSLQEIVTKTRVVKVKLIGKRR